MKRSWKSGDIGLRYLAFLLALLLWAYVNFIETGRISLISNLSR